ncbi:hypothetical protein [Planomicrobium sp. CPCC 101079]|uniref:hypothetical protein n=1 Tax=Planomicrobium sp. CPCC 101079 TaxID=2599618 RepID=UPI0011B829CB|nr:hypothetical protein [Planomicrobium sp. CPCC 101079]TWT01959.1 hypothetical protein FQV28_15125 [Planomicrobium sp. CPCC 101079]
MGLFLAGIVLWSLVILSVVLLVVGVWKKSWQLLAWSGAAMMLPSLLIFMGDDGIWFKMAILPPILLFAGAYYMRNKMKHTF